MWILTNSGLNAGFTVFCSDLTGVLASAQHMYYINWTKLAWMCAPEREKENSRNIYIIYVIRKQGWQNYFRFSSRAVDQVHCDNHRFTVRNLKISIIVSVLTQFLHVLIEVIGLVQLVLDVQEGCHFESRVGFFCGMSVCSVEKLKCNCALTGPNCRIL